MNISKQNTIITFDLHEVIFTFDLKKVFSILWHSNQKWSIFATIFHLPLNWQLIKYLWRDATDEEFYDLFAKRRAILLPLIIEMTNAQKIVPGMKQLIKDLAQAGYRLDILSNIGPRRFNQLKKDFPEMLSYFKEAKIVDPNTPLIKKPEKQFFLEYLQEYVKPNQQVVLVDDNKKNLKVARSLGMKAIRFRSANQLSTQLKEMGIQI